MTSKHFVDPPRDCDAIQELIADYAFGLTDPEETRLVESSLAACPEAVDQLADFQRLQAEMRADVPQIEPPAQLGERLMAAIAPPTRVAPLRRRPVRRSRWIAAAAVLALVITNGYWLTRVNDLTRSQEQLVSSIIGQQNNALVLTNTSGLRWVRLPPSQQDAKSAAFMMWNAESETGLLYVFGFPQLLIGKTYQLWLTRNETRVSVGTFRVDEEGKGALLFHSTEPIDKFTWARITAEPENGSITPSETIVAIGKLPT